MESRDEKLQQLSVGVAAIVAATPGLVTGDVVAIVTGLGGALIASVVENVRARTKRLDDAVRDALADDRLRARFDETVKTDEFFALYVRSRDTAAKSEKEHKLRYIRNFLVHSLIAPTSIEPDKERYLRLLDELSLRELEHFIGFCQMVVPSAGSPTIAQWLEKPSRTGAIISSFACRALGLPESTSSVAVNDLTAELVVSFRHLHSAGLLDGINTRAGGDMFHFETN